MNFWIPIQVLGSRTRDDVEVQGGALEISYFTCLGVAAGDLAPFNGSIKHHLFYSIGSLAHWLCSYFSFTRYDLRKIMIQMYERF